MPRRNGRTGTSDRRSAAANGRQLKAEGKVDKIEAKARLALAKAERKRATMGVIKWALIAIGVAFAIFKMGGLGFDLGGLLEKAKGLLPGGD